MRGFFLFLVRSWGSVGAFWLLLGVLCILGVLALLVIPLVCTRLGFQRCASCWTCPAGGVRRGIIFVTPGEFDGQHKKLPLFVFDRVCGFCIFKLFLLALGGQPSLHGYDACMVYWVQGSILEKL